ncbi:MAG: N-acetylmuramidase domain-containing protein [Cyclobacteriaceae bacterium]
MKKDEEKTDKKSTESGITSELKYIAVHIGSIILLTLAVLIFIVPSFEASNRSFASGFVILIALTFMYGIVARHISPKVKERNANFNPYHHYFFKGTVILSSLLVLFGIFGAFFVYVEHDNLFQAVGLATVVIWIAVFLIYFMWSVYHFNINYGLTDQDWQRIYDAKDRYSQGMPVKESEMETPDYNPYRSQTFGLPPGTVRGMIAFTLLMGGMSLLIVSYGSQYTGNEMALLRQQFEFFETAFLMMIAFYFGDKSLKYLRNRWTSNQPGEEKKPENIQKPGSSPQSDDPRILTKFQEDELAFQEEDAAFKADNEVEIEKPLHQQRISLSTSFEKGEELLAQNDEYVQIKDNANIKILSDMDIRNALEELESKEKIRLSLPVIKAIISIESSGRGHLQNGNAKILFEGHKFWHWLKTFKKDPQVLSIGKEHLIYEKWTRKHYRVGVKEYERFKEAKAIDAKAAIYATSWGLFQILGENLEDNIKNRNYKSPEDFEGRQHESEYIHFLDFLEFIKTKRVRGFALIDYISETNKGNYDWESFAYGYNGSGYKVNQYHIKMKNKYEEFKREEV